jgi:AraC-like DNA-binding protein
MLTQEAARAQPLRYRLVRPGAVNQTATLPPRRLNPPRGAMSIRDMQPFTEHRHESGIPPFVLRHALGGYREFVAPPSLAQFGEAVWIYRTPPRSSETGGATHRVLPELALNLAFCRQRLLGGQSGDSRLLLIGPRTKPCISRFAPGYEMAAVRLKLEHVTPLLGVRPGEHIDRVDDLSLVLPAFAGPLHDRLRQTPSAEAAASALVAALLHRWHDAPGRRAQLAAWALDLVRASNGRAPVERISARTGFSVRHLRRSVRLEAGIAIKAYARSVRFLHAVTAADPAVYPGWARLAADAGFCDQSHLVRESRALCGLSPGEVHRERRAEAEMSNPEDA